MDNNPYVRPNLAATRRGIPDPAIEVEAWLDRLEELRAGVGPEGVRACYDLLALWAKLHRVRPELIKRLDGNQEMAAAEALLAGRGPELARQALTIPNPSAWREETRTLEESYHDLIDPAERSKLAERLLTDFDNDELVLYAARRCGRDDPRFAEELDQCRSWLMEQAGLFLAAGVHVQAVGMTFRPDLPEQDYDLALTALKYERLLDALEEAEAELTLANLPPLAPRVVEGLLRTFEQESAEKQAAAAAIAILAFSRSLLRPARLGRAAEPEGPPLLLKWTKPDGGYTAYLTLAQTSAAVLTVGFYTVQGDPASALARLPVFLAEVPGQIDTEGKASFTLRAVQDTQQDLRLEVGAGREVWRPVIE